MKSCLFLAGYYRLREGETEREEKFFSETLEGVESWEDIMTDFR